MLGWGKKPLPPVAAAPFDPAPHGPALYALARLLRHAPQGALDADEQRAQVDALYWASHDAQSLLRTESPRPPSPFFLRGTLETARAIVTPYMWERQSALAIVIDEELPDLLLGDEETFRQLATLLLAHVLAGGGVLGENALLQVRRAQQNLRLQICDDPGGPAPPLEQSSLQRLAVALQGRVGVQAKLGQGTTYWCEVPLQAAPRSTGELLEDRGNILLVGGADLQRTALLQQLAYIGFTPHSVDSTEGVLTRLDSHAPKLVLLFEPEGLAAAEAELLGKHCAVREIPLVTVSTAAAAGSWRLPLTSHALGHKIEQVLGASPPPRPPLIGQTQPRVLVVEDNVPNQKLLVSWLRKFECLPNAVANGREAVRVMTELRYDAVLMDCQMPILDGYAATRMIREQEQRMQPPRHTPILALTSYSLADDRQRCLDAGMDDYLQKPIQSDVLCNAIRRWAFKQEPAPEPPSSSPQRRQTTTLDRAVLDELRLLKADNGGNLAEELLRDFLRDAPKLCTQAREGLAEGDLQKVAKAAHTLKSNSGNLGALPMSVLCGAIEDQARQGQLDGLAEHVQRLSQDYVKVEHVLAQELLLPGS